MMSRQPHRESTIKAGGPTPESLMLAANLWSSQISSWIPQNFGAGSSKPPLTNLEDILKTAGDDSERLGLGHPMIGKQNRVPRHAGLVSLERKLGVNGKGKGKRKEEGPDLLEGRNGADEDDEEEESRTSSIGKKRRNIALDLLAGKKNKKNKPTISVVANGTPIVRSPSASPASETPDNLDRDGKQSISQIVTSPSDQPLTTPPPINRTATSSPGGSGIFPFPGPLSLESPKAKSVFLASQKRMPLGSSKGDIERTKRVDPALGSAEDGEEEDMTASGSQPPGQGKSKSALKRAKKRARQEKSEADS